MQKNTVSMYFVRSAVALLSDEVRARVLNAAAISPTLAAVQNARVPAASFAALWMAVAQELDDEFFGLDSRRMKVGSFALLCNDALHSENLGQALKKLTRGFALFLDDIDATLGVRDGQAVISLADRIAAGDRKRFAHETFLVMLYGLICWLVGKRIALSAVEFRDGEPPYAREYAVMFSDNLHFGANATSIYFDARLLNAAIVQNAASLKTFLQTAPLSVFLKYRDPNSWRTLLRHRLRRCIGSEDWPVLQEIALEFHVSPTTFRRRLDAAGTSFQAIKDELRRDSAIHYLCSTCLSVPKIAALLGFHEASAFRRAFKLWTGVQPSHYRGQSSSNSLTASSL